MRGSLPLVRLVCFLLGIALGGCGESKRESQSHCITGASSACACTDGRQGAQVCADDGTFGACVCDGDIASGGAPARDDAGAPNVDGGYCTTTAEGFSGDLGGLEGADAFCAVSLPGSHFYRQSRDGARSWRFDGTMTMGHGELELGTCWNCDDWQSRDSGEYGVSSCPTGYATQGALVPSSLQSPAWRICEGDEWPLACCFD